MINAVKPVCLAFFMSNVVHVHDLVDFVSEEAEIAGKFAALTALGKLDEQLTVVKVEPGNGIRTCVPQKLSLPQEAKLHASLCVLLILSTQGQIGSQKW